MMSCNFIHVMTNTYVHVALSYLRSKELPWILAGLHTNVTWAISGQRLCRY